MLTDLLLHAALPVATPRPEVDAAAVVHVWDERRAEAWAAGDVRALRDQYAPRSQTGRADVATLAAWVARGLRVEGMRMQLLRVDVRRAGPRRLDLVVTDRLVGAVAVGSGWRRALPQDEPSSRLVTFVREAGEWRVAQARAVRTTS